METEFQMPEWVSGGAFYGDNFIRFHVHHGVELILVTEGECDIDADGTRCRGKAGTLFIMPADIPHNQVNRGMVRTVYAVFRGGVSLIPGPRAIELDDDTWIAVWLEQLARLGEETHGMMDSMASGLLSSILARLREIESKECFNSNFPIALTKALAWLEQHQGDVAGLGDLATSAGVSPGYLCVLFQRHLGQSPVQKMLNLRLERAARMLRNSYFSVKEISSRCGFNDVNYFCRRFRRHFQLSPGEYRMGGNK